MTTNETNIEEKTNLIRLMTANIENPKARNAIKRKIFGNKRDRTSQTHCQAIMVFPTTVTIDKRDSQIRIVIGKRILSNYAQG